MQACTQPHGIIVPPAAGTHLTSLLLCLQCVWVAEVCTLFAIMRVAIDRYEWLRDQTFTRERRGGGGGGMGMEKEHLHGHSRWAGFH